jgi:pantothenate synthetase
VHEPAPEKTLLAVAAFVGKSRLIDNLVLGEDSDPLAARLEA